MRASRAATLLALGALSLAAFAACGQILGIEDVVFGDGGVDGGGDVARSGDATAGGDAAPDRQADAVPDAALDGGNGGDAPAVPDAAVDSGCDAAACGYLVFVTSGSYIPGSGFIGLQSAHDLCNALASSATTDAHGRTFVAWLSTSTSEARYHISGTGSFRDIANHTIASSRSALLSGPLLGGIYLDENGKTVLAGTVTYSWTGTHSDGTPYVGGTCADWTNGGIGISGNVGVNSATDSSWTDGMLQVCSGKLHIMCFEKP